MSVMNGVHNIVRQTYILKKNVKISTLSKGITHGRGFESLTTYDGVLIISEYHPRPWV